MTLAAIVLLAAIGAWSPPKESGGGQQQQEAQNTTANPETPGSGAVVEADSASDLEKACAPGQENRNSDLCAQWKAADAAEKSAYWTQGTFFISIGGLVLTIGTLGAAVAAARYAKQAALHTQAGAVHAKRSADAAIAATAVAVGFERPILDIEIVAVEFRRDPRDPTPPGPVYRFKNYGRSPAFLIGHMSALITLHTNEPAGIFEPAEDPPEDPNLRTRDLGRLEGFVVGQNECSVEISCQTWHYGKGFDSSAFYVERTIFSGYVWYADHLGKEYLRVFRLDYDPYHKRFGPPLGRRSGEFDTYNYDRPYEHPKKE